MVSFQGNPTLGILWIRNCGSQSASDKAHILVPALPGVKPWLTCNQLVYWMKFNCLLLVCNLKYNGCVYKIMIVTILGMFIFMKIRIFKAWTWQVLKVMCKISRNSFWIQGYDLQGYALWQDEHKRNGSEILQEPERYVNVTKWQPQLSRILRSQ
jgi:hypothetical protein